MGKYALAEQEREWLNKRRKTSRCATCQEHNPVYSGKSIVKLGCTTDDGKGCPFYRPRWTYDNYRDAAEFEARVARYIAENAATLSKDAIFKVYFNEFKEMKLEWHVLRDARIAVEEEMDG